MAARVVIYLIPGHPRSTAVCKAMRDGILAVGDFAEIKSSLRYTRPEADVAVFYGLAGRLPRVMDDYTASPDRRAVYIDLGYWGRKDGGRFAGFHKVTVNGRHPTSYFQARQHDASRAAAFELKVAPWRKKGEHILVAGMGPKGARAEGYSPGEWEKRTVAELRRHTRRPIIYRPKPNWLTARPLPGADGFDDPNNKRPLEAMLANCHAVVSHHSNVGVEALLAGVPVYTVEGVATVLGMPRLRDVEKPPMPPGREQWVNDLAWCQWSVDEMARGLPWRHLKEEGLVP